MSRPESGREGEKIERGNSRDMVSMLISVAVSAAAKVNEIPILHVH